MSTYTVLGATGNCGQALMQLLLQTEGAKVKAYCRNQDKLFRLVPEAKGHPRVEVFTGSILDVDLLAKAMSGATSIFLTATTNDNIPGCHISQDLAQTVIKSLEQLKTQSPSPPPMPKLILLSSATLDPWISRKQPFVNSIIRKSAWHVYKDLELAEAFLRKHENWVSCVYIKPGGLSVDIQRGHRLTLDDEESFVSYLDIAAGMIESADAPSGKWDNKNVGIVNAGGKAKFPAGTPSCIFWGLMRYYFPFLHNYMPTGTGPS